MANIHSCFDLWSSEHISNGVPVMPQVTSKQYILLPLSGMPRTSVLPLRTSWPCEQGKEALGAGISPGKYYGRAGGCGLGGGCDHINWFPSHIKVKLTVKEEGATLPKGPGENTEEEVSLTNYILYEEEQLVSLAVYASRFMNKVMWYRLLKWTAVLLTWSL